MFKGLHNVLQKAKVVETLAPKHPDVHLVQSAEALLVPEKRQQHLKNIKALLNLPPKLYDSLYYKVIKQFAEFAQSLPETQFGIFAHEGGFLDHGLERAARALSLCLAYFFPEEKSFQGASSQEALWIYAVFTAALLLDVGKIAVKYEVELCENDGTFVKDWQLYNGSMIKQGKYYRYDYIKRNLDNLRRLVTGLIARQILDHASQDDDTLTPGTNGFSWLASNTDVLETWLMILQGEKRLPMASYLSVVPIADAQIIEHLIATKQATHPHSLIVNTLFETPQSHDENYQPNLEAGQDFLQWVREKLAKGEIALNQTNSDVHVVEDGILLGPELFEKFCRENPHYTNFENVEKTFRSMLEAYWDAPAVLQHRYRAIGGITSQQLHRFLLVARADLLFVPGFQHPLSPYVNRQPQQTIQLPASAEMQPRTAPSQASTPPPTPTLHG